MIAKAKFSSKAPIILMGLCATFLFSNACSTSAWQVATAFPPGSLDYGHGATPIDTASRTRVQVGLGGGIVPIVVSPEDVPQSSTLAGIGGGVGDSIEFQATDFLSLRWDGAVGAEWSVVSREPIAVASTYYGGQLNVTRNLALRGRLGLGVLTEDIPNLTINTVAGELGAVWSFWSSENWEAWMQGYGAIRRARGGSQTTNCRTNRFFFDVGPEIRSCDTIWPDGVSLTTVAGSSLGVSHRFAEHMEWYLTGRADMLFVTQSTGSAEYGLAIPTLGTQTGLNFYF